MASFNVGGFSDGSSDEDDGISFGGTYGRGRIINRKREEVVFTNAHLTNTVITKSEEEGMNDWFLPEDNKRQQSHEPEAYVLPIPLSEVALVDSKDSLKDFLLFLEQQVQSAGEGGLVLTGVDSEWKPHRPAGVALLQIAFRQKVFLIDVKSFNDMEDCKDGDEAFELLASQFFAAQNIIKIGFDFINDMGMLSKTHPGWKDLSERSRGILDLKNLKAELQRNLPDFFPSTEEMNADVRGLSLLAQVCLGKIVDKTEQFSNWEKRPLKSPQVLYAAADAYCLLDIYEYLKNRLASQPFDLAKYVQTCQDPAMKEVFKNLAPLQLIQTVLTTMENSPIKITVDKKDMKSVSAYFVVCDQMLAGLGKLLRYFGLHSVVLEQGNRNQAFDPRSMPYIPEGKELLILTRGKSRVPEFLAFYKPDEVLYLSEDKPIYQIIEILRSKKILFEKEDAHRVCSNCNGEVFIKLEKEEVMVIAHCPTKHSAVPIANALAVVTSHVPPEMVFYFEDDSVRRWNTLKDSSCVRVESVKRFGTIIQKAVTESGKEIQTRKLYVHLVKPYVDRVYVCDGCGVSSWSSREIEDMIFSV